MWGYKIRSRWAQIFGTHLLQPRGDEISREEGAVEVFSKLRIRSHNELDRVPPESVSAGGMA
jgi:hypothetical protein